MPPAKSVENTVVAPAVDHSSSDRTIEPRKTGSFMPWYLRGWDGGQQHAAPRPPVRDSANPGSSMGPAHGLVTARMACDAAAPARQPGDTGTIQARPLALIGAHGCPYRRPRAHRTGSQIGRAHV